MLKTFIVRLLTGVGIIAVLTSCGSKSDGTGEFATVYATASSPGTTINLIGSTASPVTSVYVITRTAYVPANTGGTSTIPASNLQINKVTLTLVPADSTSPVLSGNPPGNVTPQYPTASQPTVIVGSNNINVDLVTTNLISYLQTKLATGATASYRMYVTFEAQEVTTGKVGNIDAGFMVVNFTNQ